MRVKKPGRPRKKLPREAFVKRLLRKKMPWKLIEYKTGCSERTIRRRVLPPHEIVLPLQDDCEENEEVKESDIRAA